jgi:hypothetical protein
MPKASLEDQHGDAEFIVNEALEALGYGATEGEIAACIDKHLPEGWEWADVTAVGGPPQIVLTVFNPRSPLTCHVNCRCTLHDWHS